MNVPDLDATATAKLVRGGQASPRDATGARMEDRPPAASCRRKEIAMNKLVWLCGIGVLGACAVAPGDGAEVPQDPPTSVVTSNSFAFRPMGFARITASGGVLTAFDSTSALAAPVSVSHSPGSY